MKYSEHKNVFIYIILLLGVFYLAYLLSLPEDAIFYSGDGGLKYLMSRQFSNGDISPVLILPVTTTANKLLNKGLYPFDAPFVYEIDKRKIVSFPLYFPLISAPFFALLGWRGLYVLPAAVFFIWIWILHRFRAAKFSITTICIVLFSIVFSSPLTLYGAMYWEHAPAACLGCIPIFLFLRKKNSKQTVLKSIVLGALSGLAVFLRPEVLVCVSISICACLMCLEKQRIKQIYSFSIGFLLSIAIFFVTNRLIYGEMASILSKLYTRNVFLFHICKKDFIGHYTFSSCSVSIGLYLFLRSQFYLSLYLVHHRIKRNS
ncbi:hypothetical protein K8T06_13910 [bacterium]|nr:hypothetical protein [bacterium]